MAGGANLGRFDVLTTFCKEYINRVKKALEEHIISTDQQIIYAMYTDKEKPSSNLQLCIAGWFCLGYLSIRSWQNQNPKFNHTSWLSLKQNQNNTKVWVFLYIFSFSFLMFLFAFHLHDIFYWIFVRSSNLVILLNYSWRLICNDNICICLSKQLCHYTWKKSVLDKMNLILG